MDFPAPDLDDLADRNRLVAPEIEHSFQDEIGVQAGGSKGGGIAGLEGQREQNARVKRAVVVGVARQDEPMRQSFGINRRANRPCASSPPVP